MKNKISKTALLLTAAMTLSACGKGEISNPIMAEKEKPGDANTNTNKPSKDEEVKDVDVKELTAKAEEFSSENITDVFKYKFNKNPDASFVYSPYSHLSCVNILNKYMKMTDDNYLNKFNNCDYSKLSVANTKSDNLLIVKRKSDEDTDFDEVQFADFPEEAELKSKDLQKAFFGEELLEPDYSDPDISAVAINVIRFLGLWREVFDKGNTSKEDYTLLNGDTIKTDMMHSDDLSKDNPIAYEDDEVQIYRKPVKDESRGKNDDVSSNVYLIMPKDSKNVTKIGENISDYISKYENEGKSYGKVFLSMPKISLKSKSDLKKIAKGANKNYVDLSYKFNDKFKNRENDDLQISSIQQVATLDIDESKVEGKAITEAAIELTSLAPGYDSIFTMNIDKPFFVVVSAKTGEKDVVTFMAYVNNPNNK